MGEAENLDMISSEHYRVGQTIVHLGWVDLDLVSSLGWWAATVATYCPSMVMEQIKAKSTQPKSETFWVTLYTVQVSSLPCISIAINLFLSSDVVVRE